MHINQTGVHTHTHIQYDQDKLDDLLEEVASVEAPASAPAPPPESDSAEDTDTELLPSQRKIG